MFLAGYGGFGIGNSRTEPFDSVFLPTGFGRAGYAGRSDPRCTSGYGGGFLNLTISNTLQMDGEISSR